MTIHELREKRAKAWEAAKAFLDAHRTGNGTLTAEDDTTYTRMEQEITDLGKEIARLERQEALDAELNKPVNKPITGQPVTDKVEVKTGRASNAYKEDFALHLRGKALVHNVLSTTPDVDGGFLVPTDYEDKLVESLEEENVMRRLCKVITTHHERKIPVAVGHSVAQWTAENASYTESNPTFGQKQIDAFKLTDLCRISTELLKDSSFDIEDYLRGEFARAFGIAEEQAFCVGNGTNQPAYAESYQHIPEGFYSSNPMPPTTEQAVIMLSSHFYESRDGSTGGFFADNVPAAQQVWNTVNLLLRLDREWKV